MIHLPVDPDDVERVRGILDGSVEPASPRPAVTVVLVRDGETGLEVLLLRRNPRLSFAAGRYVFPGGSVEPSDAEEPPWSGAAPQLPSVVTAAVRETFEECGVLLAVDGEGQAATVDDDSGWEEDRVALEAASVSLAAVLRRRGLAVDASLLAPLAHWVTPTVEKRRFDTRFLIAALPHGQEAREIIGEADLHVWMRPDDALAARLPLMPPTRAMLEELEAESSATEAVARPRTFERIEPRVRLVGDKLELLLP